LKEYLIIDFDSTFIKIESLDELVKICNNQNKKIIKKIEKITKMGMEGIISFEESFSEKFKLLSIKKNDLQKVIKSLNNNISESFIKNKEFIKKNRKKIFIISGGFIELIYPVVSKFGIKKSNIFANSFIIDHDNNVIGYDRNNHLSKNKGKVEIIKNLNLNGKINVIGDGYTDYEIKREGYADKFYLFIENIKRKNILDKADFLLKSLDDFVKIFDDE